MCPFELCRTIFLWQQVLPVHSERQKYLGCRPEPEKWAALPEKGQVTGFRDEMQGFEGLNAGLPALI